MHSRSSIAYSTYSMNQEQFTSIRNVEELEKLRKGALRSAKSIEQGIKRKDAEIARLRKEEEIEQRNIQKEKEKVSRKWTKGRESVQKKWDKQAEFDANEARKNAPRKTWEPFKKNPEMLAALQARYDADAAQKKAELKDQKALEKKAGRYQPDTENLEALKTQGAEIARKSREEYANRPKKEELPRTGLLQGVKNFFTRTGPSADERVIQESAAYRQQREREEKAEHERKQAELRALEDRQQAVKNRIAAESKEIQRAKVDLSEEQKLMLEIEEAIRAATASTPTPVALQASSPQRPLSTEEIAAAHAKNAGLVGRLKGITGNGRETADRRKPDSKKPKKDIKPTAVPVPIAATIEPMKTPSPESNTGEEKNKEKPAVGVRHHFASFEEFEEAMKASETTAHIEPVAASHKEETPEKMTIEPIPHTSLKEIEAVPETPTPSSIEASVPPVIKEAPEPELGPRVVTKSGAKKIETHAADEDAPETLKPLILSEPEDVLKPEPPKPAPPASKSHFEAPKIGRGTVENKLADMVPEFATLTDGQKAVVLHGMENLMLKHVEAESKRQYHEDHKNASFFGKLGRGAIKNTLIAKNRKEALKELHTDENERLTNLIKREGETMVSRLVSKDLDAYVENGKTLIAYSGLTKNLENTSARTQQLAKAYDAAANKLANIPYNWSVEDASKKQKGQYTEAQQAFNQAKDNLRRSLIKEELSKGTDAPEVTAETYIYRSEKTVETMRYLAAHPEAEKQLKNIEKNPAFISAFKDTAAERLGYMIGGTGARAGITYAAAGTLSGAAMLAIAPGVAAFLGYKRGLNRADNARRERAELNREGMQQSGVLSYSRNKEGKKTRSWFDGDYGRKMDKLNDRLDRTADHAERQKILAEINKMAVERNAKRGLNHAVGSAERHINRLNSYKEKLLAASTQEEKDHLLFELKGRVEFMNEKLKLGQVNFGHNEKIRPGEEGTAFSRQAELMEALFEAETAIRIREHEGEIVGLYDPELGNYETTVSTKDWRTGEQLVDKNGDPITVTRARNVMATVENRGAMQQQMFKAADAKARKEEALRSAFLGATFAYAGQVFRGFGEQHGWWGHGTHAATQSKVPEVQTQKAAAPAYHTSPETRAKFHHLFKGLEENKGAQQQTTPDTTAHAASPADSTLVNKPLVTQDTVHQAAPGGSNGGAQIEPTAPGVSSPTSGESLIGKESVAHMQVSSRGMGETLLEFRHTAEFQNLTDAQKAFFNDNIYKTAAKLNLFDPHTGHSVIVGAGSEFGVDKQGEVYLVDTLHGGQVMHLGHLKPDGTFTAENGIGPIAGNSAHENAGGHHERHAAHSRHHEPTKHATQEAAAKPYDPKKIEVDAQGHPTKSAVEGYYFTDKELGQAGVRAVAEEKDLLKNIFGNPPDSTWTDIIDRSGHPMTAQQFLVEMRPDQVQNPEARRLYDFMIKMIRESGTDPRDFADGRSVADELYQLMFWNTKREMLEGRLHTLIPTAPNLNQPQRSFNMQPRQPGNHPIDLSQHVKARLEARGERHFRKELDRYFGARNFFGAMRGSGEVSQTWRMLSHMNAGEALGKPVSFWTNREDLAFMSDIHELAEDYPSLNKNMSIGDYVRRLFEERSLDKYLANRGKELVR